MDPAVLGKDYMLQGKDFTLFFRVITIITSSTHWLRELLTWEWFLFCLPQFDYRAHAKCAKKIGFVFSLRQKQLVEDVRSYLNTACRSLLL